MKRYCLLALIMLGVLSATALEVTRSGDQFTIRTAQLEARLQHGRLISLKNRVNGKIWADATLATGKMPGGLCVMTDVPNFRANHIPWGEPTLKQHLKLNVPLLNYYYPDGASSISATGTGNSYSIKYTNLTNGAQRIADATFAIELRDTPEGFLAYRLSGTNAAGKIVSAALPIVNLASQDEILTPSFGGMVQGPERGHILMPLGGAPFMEAPIMIVMRGGESAAMWIQDDRIRNFYGFIRRSEKDLGIVMESFNLMPFDGHKRIETPEFLVGVFDKSWQAAATPFRAWYRNLFAEDFAKRDNPGVAWADNIRTIIDIYMYIPEDAVLKKIADIFPPETVMFQIWNARAPTFDHELPDWTPRQGYADGVSRLHKLGFRAMAYVNTYCATYQSPVWKRDNISSFGMTRKNGLWQYKTDQTIGGGSSQNADISEKLIGTIDYAGKNENQFAKIKPGRLLYLDPLSAKWRQYHVNMMKKWYADTKTDANYEDTAGVVGDTGNGTVNGLSAGQGSVAMIRELLAAQPHVPMASEYGPEGIAFGIKWPLNFCHGWGHDAFKKFRIGKQYPLITYLFGNRQWISALGCGRAMYDHSFTSTSDATGGMGLMLADVFIHRSRESLEADRTFSGHLLQRAKVFSYNRLEPYYPEDHRYPANIRTMYKGKDGIYHFYDDGKLQQMLSPSGKALYGRVSNANHVKTTLHLANHPAQNGKEIFGLDPQANYPLFVADGQEKATALQFNTLPGHVKLIKYYEQPTTLYCELDKLPGGPAEITLDLTWNRKFDKVFINDIEFTQGVARGTLPLRLTATNVQPVRQAGEKAVPDNQVYVSTLASGIGSEASPLARAEQLSARGNMLYAVNYGHKHVNFPITVESKDTALEMVFQNLSNTDYHGCDGVILRLLVNGKEVRNLWNYTPKKGAPDSEKFDNSLYMWRLPLGEYAGKSIVVTLYSDMREQGNQDRQFIGIPRIVTDPEQKFVQQKLTNELKSVQTLTKVKQWEGAELVKLSSDAPTHLDPEPSVPFKFKKSGVIFATGSFGVVPNKIYRLSGKFRTESEYKGKGNICFGLAPFDSNHKPIWPSMVNPVVNATTELASAAPKGATVIELKDPSKWTNTAYCTIAFTPAPDHSDLPKAGQIGIKSLKGNQLTLTRPLPQDYPVGTPIGLYRSGDSFIYTGAAYRKAPHDRWEEFSGLISGEAANGFGTNMFWRGTRNVRVLILTSQPDIMFKDVKLEEVK